MRYLKTNRLYCFSPPVMLATFIIEIACVLYVLLRYRLTPITRLGIAVLICLAVFQIAEYNVCEGAWGVDSFTWAKLGYVAITFLPPLGIHLAFKIAERPNKPIVGIAYISALLFSGVFVLLENGISGQQCLGNYVIFTLAPIAALLYWGFYYGLLLVGVGYCFHFAAASKKQNIKVALYAFGIGYLAFIIPTTIVNIIDPSTILGIPSIMCGFAVILAIVLTGIVIPRSVKD